MKELYLEVKPNQHLLDQLFKIKKGTSLVIKPAPKFVLLEPKIETNYPTGPVFERNTYQELPVESDHQDQISSSVNWNVKIRFELAGTFHIRCEGWQVYVVVSPDLKVPIDAIKCQTVLSKNLGKFASWRKRLEIAHKAKYNMLHLTPIQELGGSRSAYSIKDQNKVNPNFEATLDNIKMEVEYMEKKWNILTITDIVLNHTSNDSEWLKEHPECAYNTLNSPHLRPGFLLDTAVIWFSQHLTSGKLLKTHQLDSLITTEQQVRTIGLLLKTFYVAQMNIHELFSINIDEAVSNFSGLPQSGNAECNVDCLQYERNKGRVLNKPDFIQSREDFKKFLITKNRSIRHEVRNWLDYAVENILNAIRYERLDSNGPHHGHRVNLTDRPLVAPYFTHSSSFNPKLEESLMYSERGAEFMAHNGWVMGAQMDSADADMDFASPTSMVYLKRELVAWGDCVKLRFGKKPGDCPYLWSHMRRYVETQAKIFHGFRLDNCHSTPLHVAEVMVDAARAINPDIYIMAELFTSSESVDNVFVNRLGLTTLIREANSANTLRELSGLLYRFGGQAVGAFSSNYIPLRPSVASAIFYDQTHDNESRIISKSLQDVSATSALVNMANCASGSTRGYDELVPHQINVVTEERVYADTDHVSETTGLMPLRRLLNGQLQNELQNFGEIFVDCVTDDLLAITRHNPTDGRSIVLVARPVSIQAPDPRASRPINIQGIVRRILFESQSSGDPSHFKPDPNYINGISDFKLDITSNPKNAKFASIVDNTNLFFEDHIFKPSSILCVEVCLDDKQSKALSTLNSIQQCPELEEIVSKLTLIDCNYVIFGCPEETGRAAYELLANSRVFCKFTYCGLYGLMFYLEQVRNNQDQAHPLTANLRQGSWLANYIVYGLEEASSERVRLLGSYLKKAFEQVYYLPYGMRPKHFDLVVSRVYSSMLEMIYNQRMSNFVSKGPRFVKLLALGSIALVGECQSAPLPTVDLVASRLHGQMPSIAAGLPHFSHGFMRNWGRDTFIAMRGLLLVTGRFEEAKAIILSYARTMKHGLIPNLIDEGKNSRYNCRDAVWWWLYCIREYSQMAPEGAKILWSKISRIHTNTNDKQYLHELVQEAMQRHFEGTQFREENAGPKLDEHMTSEGFNVSFGCKQDTGFVFGGNKFNCGTWMDKMGSSTKAGNKGEPASPRDGSAIELVGLSKCVLSWLDDMSAKGHYPTDGVERLYDNTITLKWTWNKWASLIQQNFEKYFYISLENEHDAHPELINKRGIYKDTVGASIDWQDYQLRPNMLVAMVVAPELFDKSKARGALKQIKEHLCGPLGMKTLDPSDWNYNGDYDNGNDSDEKKLAHGFNYHQGPEWLWLTGYYIRASSKFCDASERVHQLEILANLFESLVESPWLGLPELTNRNGAFCKDSCSTQAWSLGTILEALHESVRGSS